MRSVKRLPKIVSRHSGKHRQGLGADLSKGLLGASEGAAASAQLG